MSKQHTPTPWKRKRYTDATQVIVKGDKDIAYTADHLTGKADARYIVRACNNHDRLVEALKILSDYKPREIAVNAHKRARHLLAELRENENGTI